MKIAWTEDAWQDYLHWQQRDEKILASINALIKDFLDSANAICRHVLQQVETQDEVEAAVEDVDDPFGGTRSVRAHAVGRTSSRARATFTAWDNVAMSYAP